MRDELISGLIDVHRGLKVIFSLALASSDTGSGGRTMTTWKSGQLGLIPRLPATRCGHTNGPEAHRGRLERNADIVHDPWHTIPLDIHRDDDVCGRLIEVIPATISSFYTGKIAVSHLGSGMSVVSMPGGIFQAPDASAPRAEVGIERQGVWQGVTYHTPTLRRRGWNAGKCGETRQSGIKCQSGRAYNQHPPSLYTTP
jgi:hypothetical protein